MTKENKDDIFPQDSQQDLVGNYLDLNLDVKFDNYLLSELENIEKYKERKLQIRNERVIKYIM